VLLTEIFFRPRETGGQPVAARRERRSS